MSTEGGKGKGEISQNKVCKMFPFSLFEVLLIMLVSERFQPSQLTCDVCLQISCVYRSTYPQLPMDISLCYKSESCMKKLLVIAIIEYLCDQNGSKVAEQ